MRISLKDWLHQRRKPWSKVFYTAFRRWRADRMESVRMQFDGIGPDSVIFDVGGFQGNWAAYIHERYESQAHVFEPHPTFAQEIRHRFQGNPAYSQKSYIVTAVRFANPNGLLNGAGMR